MNITTHQLWGISVSWISTLSYI